MVGGRARASRLRRLGLARRILRDSGPGRGAVTQAALGAGFTELGCFAADYRKLFRESPSVSLSPLVPVIWGLTD